MERKGFLDGKVLSKLIRLLRNTSILTRLLICFLIIIIVPTSIVSIFNFKTYYKEIEETNTTYLKTLTDNVNYMLIEKLKNYEDLSYKVYKDDELLTLLKKNNEMCKDSNFSSSYLHQYLLNKNIIMNKLFNLTEGYGYVSNLEIVTNNDQYNQTSLTGEKKGGTIKNLESFLKSDNYLKAIAQEGYPIWFDTTKDSDVYQRQSRTPSNIANHLTLIRSIIDLETKESLGAVVLNIDLRFLINFNYINFGSKGNILFVSNGGTLLSLNENVNAPTLPKDKDLMEYIFSNDSGSKTITINGSKCLLYFRRMPNSNYYLIHLIDNMSIFKNAYEIRDLNIKILIICILIASILAYFVTLSIILPLNKLKHSMDKTAEKNLNVYYKDDSQDEIGKLGFRFNEMIKNIESLIDKIYVSEIREKTLNFRKKNAELNALQTQINSHFLYNTLDLIRWESMYQEDGEGKVSKMIADFSNLLRFNVKKGQDYVTVEEEINHVLAYLKVVNYKYTNEIQLSLDFQFDTSKYKIAKLTLQPLVENSILHGFLNPKDEKSVYIKGCCEGSTIIISVSDNGIGIKEDKLQELNAALANSPSPSSRIGIFNVNERIKLYFGEDASLKIYDNEMGGTTIKLTFPKHI